MATRLPRSGFISLGTTVPGRGIAGEFGGDPDHGLSEYNRGGTYVPDTSANVNIKTNISAGNPADFSDYFSTSRIPTDPYVPPAPVPRPPRIQPSRPPRVNDPVRIPIKYPPRRPGGELIPPIIVIGGGEGGPIMEVPNLGDPDDIIISIPPTVPVDGGGNVDIIWTDENGDIIDRISIIDWITRGPIAQYYPDEPLLDPNEQVEGGSVAITNLINVQTIKSIPPTPENPLTDTQQVLPTVTVGGVRQSVNTVSAYSINAIEDGVEVEITLFTIYFTVVADTPVVFSDVVVTNDNGDSVTLSEQFRRIDPNEATPPEFNVVPTIVWQRRRGDEPIVQTFTFLETYMVEPGYDAPPFTRYVGVGPLATETYYFSQPSFSGNLLYRGRSDPNYFRYLDPISAQIIADERNLAIFYDKTQDPVSLNGTINTSIQTPTVTANLPTLNITAGVNPETMQPSNDAYEFFGGSLTLNSYLLLPDSPYRQNNVPYLSILFATDGTNLVYYASPWPIRQRARGTNTGWLAGTVILEDNVTYSDNSSAVANFSGTWDGQNNINTQPPLSAYATTNNNGYFANFSVAFNASGTLIDQKTDTTILPTINNLPLFYFPTFYNEGRYRGLTYIADVNRSIIWTSDGPYENKTKIANTTLNDSTVFVALNGIVYSSATLSGGGANTSRLLQSPEPGIWTVYDVSGPPSPDFPPFGLHMTRRSGAFAFFPFVLNIGTASTYTIGPSFVSAAGYIHTKDNENNWGNRLFFYNYAGLFGTTSDALRYLRNPQDRPPIVYTDDRSGRALEINQGEYLLSVDSFTRDIVTSFTTRLTLQYILTTSPSQTPFYVYNISNNSVTETFLFQPEMTFNGLESAEALRDLILSKVPDSVGTITATEDGRITLTTTFPYYLPTTLSFMKGNGGGNFNIIYTDNNFDSPNTPNLRRPAPNSNGVIYGSGGFGVVGTSGFTYTLVEGITIETEITEGPSDVAITEPVFGDNAYAVKGAIYSEGYRIANIPYVRSVAYGGGYFWFSVSGQDNFLGFNNNNPGLIRADSSGTTEFIAEGDFGDTIAFLGETTLEQGGQSLTKYWLSVTATVADMAPTALVASVTSEGDVEFLTGGVFGSGIGVSALKRPIFGLRNVEGYWHDLYFTGDGTYITQAINQTSATPFGNGIDSKSVGLGWRYIPPLIAFVRGEGNNLFATRNFDDVGEAEDPYLYDFSGEYTPDNTGIITAYGTDGNNLIFVATSDGYIQSARVF